MMQEEDLPAILAIQAICYTQVAPESGASLWSKRNASPQTCFVAWQRQRLAGYLFSVPWRTFDAPALNVASYQPPTTLDCLYLHDLAVAPTARQAGVGQALVGAFLDAWHRSGLPSASLVAIQDSAPYWQRLGFRPADLPEKSMHKLASYGQSAKYMVQSASGAAPGPPAKPHHA